MFHLRKMTASSPIALLAGALETKEDSLDEIVKTINKTIEGLTKNFEEFKSTNDDRLKELKKKGNADPLVEEKLKKIEDSLDTFVEAKSALEKRIEAEKKEREALELRIQKLGTDPKLAEKSANELKEFNDLVASIGAERRRSITSLDEKSYEEYVTNFKSWLRYGANGHNVDLKTMLVGSDPDGGYFVTPDLSGRIATKVYETSDMRAICSVQSISTDALEGMEDLGEAGAGYAGETSQGSDTTTPQIGKWRIPVYWIDTEPKTTQQLLDDASVDIEAWLAGKVADKFARFENAEFVNGATKIRGLCSYTTAADGGSGVAWGSFEHVVSGANGDFAGSTPSDKLFDLIGALKNAYLGNSRWLTRRSVITKIRKFKESTTNGYIWQPGLQAGQPESLLGFPVTRAEDMPALATGSLSLAFGDFRTAYQIVDRMGIRVVRDNLTSKPFIKFYTTKRVGGGAVNFEAVKFMKFSA